MKNFNEEKFKELNKRIDYKDEQKLVGISNRHFNILVELVNRKELKTQHIPYAFSYIYLHTYLFRYTKYETYVPTVGNIKEILTYDKSTKTLNYIIKDGGVLDAASLTKTIYDFPVIHEWENKQIEFTMLSSFNDGKNGYGSKWRKLRNINFNTSCKYPVLGFYDDIEIYKQLGVQYQDLGGTFFTTYNLTQIEWNLFNYCMAHEELGCTGFYLYSFIKSQEGKTGNCMLGIEKIAKYCGIAPRTVSRYLTALRQYNLIHCISANFVVGANYSKESVEQESNTYFANNYEDITDYKLELTKPNYISVEHYLENKRIQEFINSTNEGQDTDTTDFYAIL